MNTESLLARTNLPGAVLAIAILVLCILIFTARLFHRPALGLQIGIILELTALPLLYLLWSAPQAHRPFLYYLQVGLMLAFLLVELLLDYIFKVNFRGARGYVIPYVMLFFAGTGGMVGIAAQNGPAWVTAAGVLFLITAALAFLQRAWSGL